MANKEHSFYKEAKKSFSMSDSFTKEKIWKNFKKYSKWTLYLFLTITTLWGCVNQIRHNTSQLTSQGMEFYVKYEDVLPNLYTGYETKKTYFIENAVKDEEGNIVKDEEGEVIYEPGIFDFYTINPYFALEDENVDLSKLDTESFFIKTGEKTDIKGNLNPSTFSHVLSSEGTTNNIYLSLLPYNWTNISNGMWVLPWSFESISNDSKEKIMTDIIGYSEEKPENGWKNIDFYNALKQTNSISDEEYSLLTHKKVDENGDETEEDVANSYVESYLVPVEGFNIKDKFEFNVIERLEFNFLNFSFADSDSWIDKQNDEKKEYLYEFSVYMTNLLAYYNVENNKNTPNKFDNFESEFSYIDNNSETNEPKEITTTIKEFVKNFIKEDLNVVNIDNEKYNYSVDFSPLHPESVDSRVVSGKGFISIPQTKIDPIFPTFDAFESIKKKREETNWLNDFSKTSAGEEERIDKAGWSVLSKNSNINRWENIYFYEDEALSEDTKDFFYWNNKQDVSNFLNRVKNGEIFLKSDNVKFESTVNNNDFSLKLSSENFIGFLGSYDYFQGYTNDNFKGSLSTFDDFISQSGQDKDNLGRDIFTSSMSDWGDAWDPDYGPLYGMFMWPLAQLSLGIQSIFGSNNSDAWATIFSIFLITFLLRGIGFLMSFKSSKSQSKTQELQTQIAQINSKYSQYDKKNKQMKQKKQQEIMALYRKHDVNPFSSIGTIFITMPIFLSLWTIISSIAIYKVSSIGAFKFSISSFYGMFHIGSFFFAYLLVGVAVGLTQGVSSKLPNWLANKRKGIKRIDDSTKEAMKKQNKTQNIMIGVFVFMGLTVPVLLAIYWIFSGMFSMLVELIKHIYKEQKSKKIKEK